MELDAGDGRVLVVEAHLLDVQAAHHAVGDDGVALVDDLVLAGHERLGLGGHVLVQVYVVVGAGVGHGHVGRGVHHGVVGRVQVHEHGHGLAAVEHEVTVLAGIVGGAAQVHGHGGHL